MLSAPVASGRLTSLILTGDALDLAPAELSALILATAATALAIAATAQKQVARAAVALSSEVFGAGDGIVSQLRGELEARIGSLDEDDPASPGIRW